MVRRFVVRLAGGDILLRSNDLCEAVKAGARVARPVLDRVTGAVIVPDRGAVREVCLEAEN